jgi:hypothetical protein
MVFDGSKHTLISYQETALTSCQLSLGHALTPKRTPNMPQDFPLLTSTSRPCFLSRGRASPIIHDSISVASLTAFHQFYVLVSRFFLWSHDHANLVECAQEIAGWKTQQGTHDPRVLALISIHCKVTGGSCPSRLMAQHLRPTRTFVDLFYDPRLE